MVSLSLLLIEDKYLRFIVSDEGEGFDPSNLADPTAPENIELEGGRGIFLINSLCDKVEFKNEGKSIELTFNL
jgi:serine/threonine-protein kinase RsbW